MVLFTTGPVGAVGEIQALSVRHQIGKPLLCNHAVVPHPPQKMAVFLDHTRDGGRSVSVVLHSPQLAGDAQAGLVHKHLPVFRISDALACKYHAIRSPV